MKSKQEVHIINYDVEIAAACKIGNKLLERLKAGDTPANIMATKANWDNAVKNIPSVPRLQSCSLLSVMWRYTELLKYYRKYFEADGAALDTLLFNKDKQLQKKKMLN